MSALAAARDAQRKDSDLISYKQPATSQIWKGGAVSVRVADGYAYPARNGTATDIFVGVAYESSLSGSVAGATRCRVQTTGIYTFAGSGFAQTDVGAAVYASDDQTVTKTSTNAQQVGVIVEFISATLVRVKIDGFAL